VLRKAPYILPLGAAFVIVFAIGCHSHKSGSNEARRVLYYQDPMHPSYRSDKPGVAPDCGMNLVPVYADNLEDSMSSTQGPAAAVVRIDPAIQQLYGVKLARVEEDSGQGSVRAFGRVAADETRVFSVDFGTEGYVKETHDDAVGNHVEKDQHLAVVYSPDFLAVEGGYLAANEHSPGSPNLTRDNSVSGSQGTASVQARADRLRNLGMSDSQINEISQEHKIPEYVFVVSPTDGFILSRNITPGMRFERHSALYTIADLSHVWILADLFGKDAQAVRPGAKARVTLPDTGESFTATVSHVLPEVDPNTHALKTRLEADNPGFKLRPNMFVTVDLPVSQQAGLTVPSDSVLDSGISKRVFVQTAPGYFESRFVETGSRMDDRVRITKGLQEGEIVVSSGTFLVDSESRLTSSEKQNSSAAKVLRATTETEHHGN